MTLLANVRQAQRRLRAASVRQDEARDLLREAVREARESHTLAEIGEALGMTKQSVHALLREES